MKKLHNLYKIGSGFLLALSLLGTTGCSDEFLAEKRPYGKFGPDQVYGDWNSLKLRLNYLYEKSLPTATSSTANPTDIWSVGYCDILSANTDEFTGWGKYQDPLKVWDNTNIDKFFYYGINESPWKKIRECNDVISRTNSSTFLSQLEKDEAVAQARFFRAFRYFRLFKRYGGVPIVDTLQSTLRKDTVYTRVQRSSSEDTYRFMINDCIFAGEHLPARWEEEDNDWGRIVAGTGYALGGIIANYYASPVFNRADEAERWNEAYEINKKALDKLAEGNFGLAYADNPGTNASGWAKIWCNMTASDGNVSEGVFVSICNNLSDDNPLNNGWEQIIRPTNCKGRGGLNFATDLIDEFPMADGKRPTEAGTYTYDNVAFFLNRDPRFYRTYAFPGVQWKFNGSLTSTEENTYPYNSGNNYQLYNFAWYTDVVNAADEQKTGYFTDGLLSGGRSVYVRKKSQDAALNNNSLYIFNEEEGFARSGQPLIIIRYTEVLLNFAEAACGANHLDEAWDALVRIRQRVGYTGDCGLNPEIKADRAKMFEAILYERQIELAYEGKRFDDCMRWMLFDGGVGQETINPSWALTGWNGNTCTYLGVTPLVEKEKHQFELYFNPEVYLGTSSRSESDPFLSKKIQATDENGNLVFDKNGNPVISEEIPAVFKKPNALTLNENMTATVSEEGVDADGAPIYVTTYANSNVKALADFYHTNLLRKDKNTTWLNLANNPTITSTITWDPKFYFMGLAPGDQENNPGVVQTMGWASRFGGMGVFDPLSKNPIISTEQERNNAVTEETEVTE